MGMNKVVVLGTGGTIAGRSTAGGDVLNYQAGEVPIDQLVRGIPVGGECLLVSEQVMQLDSKDMNEVGWLGLWRRCRHWLEQDDVRAVVITHGTDTLEETAFFLDATLSTEKPVVLTCAMRPATAPVPDGPQNLADAVALAVQLRGGGVFAVCAGLVHRARDVQKVHTDRLNAFDSGDVGPWGEVVAGQVRAFGRFWAPSVRISPEEIERQPPQEWPRVELITSHAGADGAMVRALMQSAPDTRGVAGFVVAGTGNGTIAAALEAALTEAQNQGIRVVRSTRCARGRVTPIRGAAIADSKGLSPVKARIALMLELMGGIWLEPSF